MTVVAGFDPTEISLSDSAVGKLQFLIAEEDNPSLRFRVYITGGGAQVFSTALPLTKKPPRMTGSLSERASRHSSIR
jgi:Fe-S cluster assembly iron-binding protein IscA